MENEVKKKIIDAIENGDPNDVERCEQNDCPICAISSLTAADDAALRQVAAESHRFMKDVVAHWRRASDRAADGVPVGLPDLRVPPGYVIPVKPDDAEPKEETWRDRAIRDPLL